MKAKDDSVEAEIERAQDRAMFEADAAARQAFAEYRAARLAEGERRHFDESIAHLKATEGDPNMAGVRKQFDAYLRARVDQRGAELADKEYALAALDLWDAAQFAVKFGDEGHMQMAAVAAREAAEAAERALARAAAIAAERSAGGVCP